MKLDEKEAQEIMEDLNDRYASALLLFAWQKFQHYPKGLVTRITALDTSGFTAETTTTTHENIHNIYKFTDDDNKRNKNKSLKQKLTDTIYMNMKIPKCPPQGYICYAIWAFFIIGVMVYRLPPLAGLQPLFSFMGSTNITRGIIAMTVVHFLEMNYILHQMMNAFEDIQQKPEYSEILVNYGYYGFVLGLPITTMVYRFVAAVKKIPRAIKKSN